MTKSNESEELQFLDASIEFYESELTRLHDQVRRYRARRATLASTPNAKEPSAKEPSAKEPSAKQHARQGSRAAVTETRTATQTAHRVASPDEHLACPNPGCAFHAVADPEAADESRRAKLRAHLRICGEWQTVCPCASPWWGRRQHDAAPVVSPPDQQQRCCEYNLCDGSRAVSRARFADFSIVEATTTLHNDTAIASADPGDTYTTASVRSRSLLWLLAFACSSCSCSCSDFFFCWLCAVVFLPAGLPVLISRLHRDPAPSRRSAPRRYLRQVPASALGRQRRAPWRKNIDGRPWRPSEAAASDGLARRATRGERGKRAGGRVERALRSRRVRARLATESGRWRW